ncbi:MAG: carbohydrate ABC transporter permease [Candidatus Brocadiae bacterium]|nr:carbohydrate ABC transporter permease [Candidatus Brocadiia bacterium]
MKRLLPVAVAAMAAFSLGPFLWSALTSLKPADELFRVPPTWIPRSVSLDNYRDVFAQRPFARYMVNSLFVAGLSTILTLAAGAPAAWALARLRLRWSAAIEKGFLAFALFPPAVLLVPLFVAARDAGVLNSRIGVAFVHAALNLPFAVWSLTSFFRAFPADLEDAARVDGFSRAGVLLRVVFPVSAPALAATAILVFIFSWNEFVIALTFLTRDELRTVPVGVAMLSGVTAYDIPWGQISAAVVVTTLPVVAAVLAFQRSIVQGLGAGAVKG